MKPENPDPHIKTAAQAVAGALSKMTAFSKSRGPLNTSQIPSWETWVNNHAKRRDEKPFQTLGDPGLIAMLSATARFVQDIKTKAPPHWLSLVGSNGIGKTRLARSVWDWYHKGWLPVSGLEHEIPKGSYEKWEEVVSLLRAQQANAYTQDMAEGYMLVLDDIGRVADNTGYITSELSALLGRRVGKWTIITCNFGMEEICNKIDQRVASRMRRNESEVVEVVTTDWDLRPEARL